MTCLSKYSSRSKREIERRQKEVSKLTINRWNILFLYRLILYMHKCNDYNSAKLFLKLGGHVLTSMNPFHIRHKVPQNLEKTRRVNELMFLSYEQQRHSFVSFGVRKTFWICMCESLEKKLHIHSHI